jgi:hypothetical protein
MRDVSACCSCSWRDMKSENTDLYTKVGADSIRAAMLAAASRLGPVRFLTV